jgi:DNA (cytosine-5)-methyltransferase 1
MPAGTVTTCDHHSLVAVSLVRNFGRSTGADLDDPAGTVTGKSKEGLVSAFLMKYYGTDQDPNLAEPLHTVTTKDRFGLVTVQGEIYSIADIGMRMLAPRELFRAQGFPEDYIIDRDANGRAISKTEQVAKCGNSVCPPLAEALVRANMAAAGVDRKERRG